MHRPLCTPSLFGLPTRSVISFLKYSRRSLSFAVYASIGIDVLLGHWPSEWHGRQVNTLCVFRSFVDTTTRSPWHIYLPVRFVGVLALRAPFDVAKGFLAVQASISAEGGSLSVLADTSRWLIRHRNA